MTQNIICVVGPTAVGKTALGIELAKRFGGEIISGDSQQVYRHLDIGTAKASQEEQASVVHHLIDVRDVSESYSAFDFVKEAQRAIVEIDSRGQVPFVVGGTGLYVQSLLEGYHLGGKVNQDEVLAYRKELESLSDEELEAIVKQKGLRIPQYNRRRATRALELERFSSQTENTKPAYNVLLIGLDDDRQQLYERINARVDSMLSQGLLNEAKWLYDHYPDAQASRAIGYKELFPYFRGEVSLDEAVASLKQNTRRFAKRQLTWFRNRMDVDWYRIDDENSHDKMIQRVKAFLSETKQS
ncbi:tRNA (adenosine(37)-N6)-dimethylallyltransferase MiaA [Streptococcus sp. zg-JUN1979]|uniref:tRNA (adenosine(37)-N6)-dimethylallyltransferase MiaA n=1 Tax=Streptococcus sp. zg-JUN1979 TaxID=3391450 RepID=UPI0039A556A6